MSGGRTAAPSPREAGPPALLLIHREAVAPEHALEHAGLESAIARACHELGGPHPYLALETLTGSPEVWFLNGFASLTESQEVGARYAANTRLMATLAETSRRKATLVVVLGEHLASCRTPAHAWRLGHDCYLVVTIGRDGPQQGVTFEAPDGTWFGLEGAIDPDAARALAARRGPSARALAVRPSWSYPAPEWVQQDPELWSGWR